ncbi:DUF7385 family protein [Halapricum desulfuricans]|uniref:Flagella cluster protein n=1 Tax=Halapricum desulfuricans TaxID=2841257 RepID=A0A897NP25_9EURY|nr:flagella cluster protein [Halapricum desulfuricans]QSG14522.1 Uncharacterized protein HSEST_0986 [Halapricum desulfuricans]
MARLDVSDGFDVHEYREGFKLRKETRRTMQLENRGSFECPACGKPFEELFVSEKRTNTFQSPPGPFCLVRTDDQLLLFTH